LLYKKTKTIDEVLEKIEKITVEDINRVAKKLLQPERMKLAIIGPYQEVDKENFEKLLK
jgi:predicted Zn-dependent peptidase